MNKPNLLVLITILWSLLSPALAGDTLKVGRPSGPEGKVSYTLTQYAIENSAEGKTLVFGKESMEITLPRAASHLTVEQVDCWGDVAQDEVATDNCSGFVKTKGNLRIRAKVRYGWFDGFQSYDNRLPILELFIHKDSEKNLPRNTNWTPGGIHEFTVTNETQVLKQLFAPQQLKLVRSKKKLFIEVDSDLLLSDINFGDECGIRYFAKVITAKPWVDAQVVAKSKGWDGHC
ncbi:hypothetical protein [Rhodoferax sp.]|uniref:hypothetical protein n=1 Tax=Rhodoferax sp. TaxID=50421 RepID=UPI0025FDF55F|nr:hypothetical protein [Rhodoferax sp.]